MESLVLVDDLSVSTAVVVVAEQNDAVRIARIYYKTCIIGEILPRLSAVMYPQAVHV